MLRRIVNAIVRGEIHFIATGILLPERLKNIHCASWTSCASKDPRKNERVSSRFAEPTVVHVQRVKGGRIATAP